jgi:predicted nuclease of restriction endonuclease-like RecB superfamily
VPDRLHGNEETATKKAIAAVLGRAWEDVERDLFADASEYRRLEAFEDYPSATALLARYNVAQAQAVLYDAVEMVVWATDDFKTIVRYAKLAGLMHTIRRRGEAAFEMRFDGPASVLRETRRYGTAMARFLPALIACRGWRMHAVVKLRRGGRLASFDLAPADGLTSHLPGPEEFDSMVEAAFACGWGEGRREGWALEREGEMLVERQKVFVPDFVLRHEDGRTVYFEIVGFWTPAYLQAKLDTLRVFREYEILLAVSEYGLKNRPELGPDAISYKKTLQVGDVLARLRNFGASD